MSPYGNGDILEQLRKMVEDKELNERPAIRLLLTSNMKIIVGVEALTDKLENHNHEGTDKAIEILLKQQSAGDKFARTIAIVAGFMSLGFLLMGFLHVF
jgi:hypothetical protein